MHVCLADDWEGEPTSFNPNEHGNIQWFDPTTVTDLDLACETYPQLLAHARHWHQTRRPDHSPPGAISRTSFRPDPAIGASWKGVDRDPVR